jgi:hypothetical protein
MKASEKAQFAELLTDALAFYRREPSKFALSVWWQACQPFDFEQVAKALTAHAMDPERGQFPPMPADIVKHLQGTQTDRSLIAWGKVLDAIQRVGAYQSVVFDDGAIHATIEDMGGWVKLCRSNTDELPHLQRRFTETYRAYARRPDMPYPPRLTGAHEQANALTGKSVAPPMLVGDAMRAQGVLKTGTETGRIAITPLDALPPMRRLGKSA